MGVDYRLASWFSKALRTTIHKFPICSTASFHSKQLAVVRGWELNLFKKKTATARRPPGKRPGGTGRPRGRQGIAVG